MQYLLGGRSPFTWYPQSYVDQVPMTDMNMRANSSRNFPGRTYRFYNGESLYEFGYGLSYSTFLTHIASAPSTIMIQNNISISKPLDIFLDDQAIDISTASCLNLTFSLVIGVKNNGPFDGSHVVLVFWEPPSSEVMSGVPIKQLIGFERVHVKVRMTKFVTVKIDICKLLSNVDSDGKRKLVIGKHTILIGSSNEKQVRHNIDITNGGQEFMSE
jgi:beta-D-xylosidase 4